MKFWLKFLFLIWICVQMSACAASSVSLPNMEEQEGRWKKFIQRSIEEKPYALQGSFRFGDSKNTNRVNYIFWSNGAVPLRLDVMAGVGASIAKILESKERILMYFVQDKQAILMDNFDEMNPLVSLGMPVPFSFYEMSLLLRGGFNQVLQDIHLDSVKSKKSKTDYKKYTYYFSSLKMDGLVQLNKDGLPVHCEINNEWAFDIVYDDTAKLPSRVVISSLLDDYRAILLVKERSYPKEYTEEDLRFPLPDGTEILNN